MKSIQQVSKLVTLAFACNRLSLRARHIKRHRQGTGKTAVSYNFQCVMEIQI